MATILGSIFQREDSAADPVSAETAPAADVAFLRCVARLEEVIEFETGILTSGARIDFEALNFRKTHALLELTRVARNNPPTITVAARERLERLSELLAVNSEILQQHLRAMKEITELIVDRIRDDESDGTYSRLDATRSSCG